MEISDTVGQALSPWLRVFRIAGCAIPTLFGLFMVLWGIFIGLGDWIVTGVGMAIILIFGGALYRAIRGTEY
jgi:hypothetical protein